MRMRWPAVVSVLCFALAGCASAAAQGAPSYPQANRTAAVAETTRLLGLVTVPASATRRSSAPTALLGPVAGTPQSRSLVDTARFWDVPMSLPDALAWIAAHPPRGLRATGSARSSGPAGVISAGVTYADNHASRAWTDAQLQLGVASAGASSTVWRADGLASWRSPRPAPAPTGGRRLAVTVAGGCPASDRGYANVPPGSSRSLLPVAPRPTSALICAYRGLDSRAFTVRRHVRVGAGDAARLAHLASAISLAHTTGEVVNCPADHASATVVAFAYRHEPAAALWLADSGCPSLSNGTILVGIGGDAAGVSAFATRTTALLHR